MCYAFGEQTWLLPVLTVFHQSGEVGQVSAHTDHTFVSIQTKQHIPEFGQIPVKPQKEKINKQGIAPKKSSSEATFRPPNNAQ